jgi:ribosomal protein S18 acetylase RimI-like enzyme
MLRFEWNPAIEESLALRLREIWVAATNAGGALGFLPPVTLRSIVETADLEFRRVNERIDDLLVAFLDDEPIGWLRLERDPRAFSSHWRTVKRLQVDPAHQRSGHGTSLLREARRFAREDLGIEFLLLTVRAGNGTEALYRKLGYQEVGRVPGAMRVSPGDDRDEIFMVLAPL